jgi:hypothetical protein
VLPFSAVAVLVAHVGQQAARVSLSSGALNVTCTTPGWRPISIAPLIVARFITSGTSIDRSSAARFSPLSVALFRSGPEPTTEIGADSSSPSSPTR